MSETPRIARVGNPSMWGEIQHSRRVGENMYLVSTASHGGIILTDDHLRWQVQNKLGDLFGRDFAFCPNATGSWKYWEEDCDAPFIIDLLSEAVDNDEIRQSEIDSKHFQAIMKWTRERYGDQSYPPATVAS